MPGPFAQFRKNEEAPLMPPAATQDGFSFSLTDVWEDPDYADYRLQATAVIVFVTTILLLRLSSTGRIKALKGEHVLVMTNLNNASLFKEVMLAYLNAALLEPVLAIGGMEAAEGAQFMTNLLTLGSICWWIWLLTDAFDFEDVMQFFKYHVELRAERDVDPKRFFWLRLKDTNKDAEMEQKVLSGSVTRDIAVSLLYFEDTPCRLHLTLVRLVSPNTRVLFR